MVVVKVHVAVQARACCAHKGREGTQLRSCLEARRPICAPLCFSTRGVATNQGFKVSSKAPYGVGTVTTCNNPEPRREVLTQIKASKFRMKYLILYVCFLSTNPCFEVSSKSPYNYKSLRFRSTNTFKRSYWIEHSKSKSASEVAPTQPKTIKNQDERCWHKSRLRSFEWSILYYLFVF